MSHGNVQIEMTVRCPGTAFFSFQFSEITKLRNPDVKRPRKTAQKVILITLNLCRDQQQVSMFESEKKVYSRSISGLFFLAGAGSWCFSPSCFFHGLSTGGSARCCCLIWRRGGLHRPRLVLFIRRSLIYLDGLLIICALAPFSFTAVAGRLWCGFSCPQTVYTEIFVWIESKVEGDRSARMRFDKNGWTFEKIGRNAQAVSVDRRSAVDGLHLQGYFVPIRHSPSRS